MFGEFAREQRSQHVGDGHSALKGGDLDASALYGSDVDREPRGVETWLCISRRRGLRAAHPGFGVAGTGREGALRIALTHSAILSISAASAAISRPRHRS